MIFRRMSIEGLYVVELDRHEDRRGFFARTYCEDEFHDHGLNTHWPQCNMSHSIRKGTIRGIHYQSDPLADAKLIRVTRGRVFCAAVDLRLDGGNFGRRLIWNLDSDDGAMLYIPAGCGFGFQTLADDTELHYQMSVRYRAELARGVRWNDPDLDICWPLPPTSLSDADAAWPLVADVFAAIP